MVVTGSAHAEDLLSLLRSKRAASEVRWFAARGILPLEPDDRMRALFTVLEDPDPEIAAAARATLTELPPDAFSDFLRGEKVLAPEIERVASLTDDVLVLEKVVGHRNVSDETLLRLARTVSGAPQEALVVNQARLLRNPALIDALYENPALTADSRRVLNELKEEFFEKEARRREARQRAAAQPPEAEPEAGHDLAPASADAGGLAEDLGEEPAATPGTDDAPPADASGPPRGAEEIYLYLMRLTVPERVKLALRGTKEERRFLIADSSRMVVLAVLRARGLTITEVESFCKMRHVEDEVFYQISRKRQWIRRPAILQALVRNPKVPFAITMPLIPRLSMRDLRNISRDRNLPEAIRTMAKKTYLHRRK